MGHLACKKFSIIWKRFLPSFKVFCQVHVVFHYCRVPQKKSATTHIGKLLINKSHPCFISKGLVTGNYGELAALNVNVTLKSYFLLFLIFDNVMLFYFDSLVQWSTMKCFWRPFFTHCLRVIIYGDLVTHIGYIFKLIPLLCIIP